MFSMFYSVFFQGENHFIKSICQTIFSINELLEILTDPEISNNLKRPFVRFLLWVYLNTASGMIASGAGELPHDRQVTVSNCVVVTVLTPCSLYMFTEMLVFQVVVFKRQNGLNALTKLYSHLQVLVTRPYLLKSNDIYLISRYMYKLVFY